MISGELFLIKFMENCLLWYLNSKIRNMEWKASIVKYKKQDRIAVYFKKSKELIVRIKKLEDAQWSYSLGAWHLPNNEENRKRFKLENAVLRADKAAKTEQFSKWLKSKRYSDNTIKTYTDALKSFLFFLQYQTC